MIWGGEASVVAVGCGRQAQARNALDDRLGLDSLPIRAPEDLDDGTGDFAIGSRREETERMQALFDPNVPEDIAAVGVNGIFVEVHDRPEKALSDGPNALRLDLLAGFWERVNRVHQAVQQL